MNIQEFSRYLLKLKDMIPTFAPSFTPEITASWFQYFKDLDLEVFGEACRKAVETQHSFPSIAKLLQLCGQGDDPSLDKEKATELAELCFQVAGCVGGYKYDEAEIALGPVAWAAIQRSGGWADFCMVDLDQKTTIVAQMRDLIMSLLHKQRAGIPLLSLPNGPGKGELPPIVQQALEAAKNDVKPQVELPKKESTTPLKTGLRDLRKELANDLQHPIDPK